jgi:hypothetical protein
MNILAAIKREEKKIEKQMSVLQHKLNGVRSAAKALGTFGCCRSEDRKEARSIGCGTSRDFEGSEEALGEGQKAGEESR